MILYVCQNEEVGLSDAVTFISPSTTGMNHIPIGTRLLIAPFAGVVIPKPINGSVPERAVKFYESGFNGTNHI